MKMPLGKETNKKAKFWSVGIIHFCASLVTLFSQNSDMCTKQDISEIKCSEF